MSHELIIFDCDGTLANSLPAMRLVYNELAAAHGLRQVAESEEPHFRQLHGMALLRALQIPLWKLPRIMKDMRARVAEYAGRWGLFQGVAEALRDLVGKGKRLGIVSSNSQANVQAVLGPEQARLVEFYDCGASMFGKARKLRRVVRTSGVASAKVIYVGDEVRDGEAAREAGIAFGAVAWGYHELALLQTQHPRASLHTPAQLAEL